MIYLDNAATTMHKPQTVIDAVTQAMCSLGNAGRGATSGALDAARTIHGCRAKLARLLGCPRADHVCFTPNSTAALNTAINGVVHPGDRVVTTVLEHNSVLRPLNRLATEQGVTVEHAGCDASGVLDYDELERLVTPGTRAVVVTHASNVTGNAVDVARVAAMAHAAGALVIIDASQSAGTAHIDMQAMGLDVVCFTGHKGLMGPQGTGGLAVADGVDVAPWALSLIHISGAPVTWVASPRMTDVDTPEAADLPLFERALADAIAQALAAPPSTFEPSAVSWEACLGRILKVVDLLEGGSYG